jgi:drug/metabolite transporter (DMT)-like permease
MGSELAYISGLGCSICYGISTVLQQEGTRKQDKIESFHISNAYNLLKQLQYVIGLVLDLVGWLLFLYSAHQLPLFLCLSFVSFSLFTTALIARVFKNVKITKNELLSLASIFIGLVLVSVVAKPSEAKHAGVAFKLVLELGPILLALLGIKYLKDKKSNHSALVLSALAGLTYGATGIISRLIQLNKVSDIFQLLVISIAAYGLIGMIYLAAALQRENVNRINSIMYSFELVIPSVLGIIFLGDKVKSNDWFVMAIGVTLVVFGSLMIAFNKKVSKTVKA